MFLEVEPNVWPDPWQKHDKAKIVIIIILTKPIKRLVLGHELCIYVTWRCVRGWRFGRCELIEEKLGSSEIVCNVNIIFLAQVLEPAFAVGWSLIQRVVHRLSQVIFRFYLKTLSLRRRAKFLRTVIKWSGSRGVDPFSIKAWIPPSSNIICNRRNAIRDKRLQIKAVSERSELHFPHDVIRYG